MEPASKKLKLLDKLCRIYTTDNEFKGAIRLEDITDFDDFSTKVVRLPSITRLGNKLLFCDRGGVDFANKATPKTYLTEETWGELVQGDDTMQLVVVANMVVLRTQSEDVIIPTNVAKQITVKGYSFAPQHAAWRDIFVDAPADVVNSLITRVIDKQFMPPQFGTDSAEIRFDVTAAVEFWYGDTQRSVKPQLTVGLLCTATGKSPEECIRLFYYPLTHELEVNNFLYNIDSNVMVAIREYVKSAHVGYVLRRHEAKTSSRTLAGFAMEWVKAVANFCDKKCIVQINMDSWTGPNGMTSQTLSQLSAQLVKETSKVKPLVRRAARVFGLDWDAMDAYLQRVESDGFYGQFGFKGTTKGNKQVNVTDMITLNAPFADLAL